MAAFQSHEGIGSPLLTSSPSKADTDVNTEPSETATETGSDVTMPPPNRPAPSPIDKPSLLSTSLCSQSNIYSKLGIIDFEDKIRVQSHQYCNMCIEVVEYNDKLKQQIRERNKINQNIEQTKGQIETTEKNAIIKLNYVAAMRKRVNHMKIEGKHRELEAKRNSLNDSSLLFDDTFNDDEMVKSLDECENRQL